MKKSQEKFTLSQTKSIRGSRHLAREKVLQILTAVEISKSDWNAIFDHVFSRDFNFDDVITEKDKLLTQEQILELESDIPIIWKDEEVEFAKKLIQNTFSMKDEIQSYIKEISENWSLDRITLLDKIIIEMAITEFLLFPEIPVKVSINEAMEIGKNFSTDKSPQFINGILDKIHHLLIAKNKIKKSGRGLIDN